MSGRCSEKGSIRSNERENKCFHTSNLQDFKEICGKVRLNVFKTSSTRPKVTIPSIQGAFRIHICSEQVTTVCTINVSWRMRAKSDSEEGFR